MFTSQPSSCDKSFLIAGQKISVKNLLEQTQINRNFIYDLEKGGQIPSAEKLERIADYLDCSVDYLLGRTDNPAVNR